MANANNRAQFVEAAMRVHAGKYTYGNAVYTNARTKLAVTCPDHGDFFVTPTNHISRESGCPACYAASTSARCRLTYEDFVHTASARHGGKYAYVESSYTKASSRVNIVCPDHGVYSQVGAAHLSGAGCPACNVERLKRPHNKRTADSFAAAFRDCHGGKLRLVGGDYTTCKHHVRVVCGTHGEFRATPDNLMQGRGCPSCAVHASTPEDDICRFVEAHGATAVRRYRPAWMRGLELDVFVPEHNVAVEYCGSAFHASANALYGDKPAHYHVNKWRLCRDNGVTLVTIFDFVWATKRRHVLYNLLHHMQLSERLYARYCSARDIDPKQAAAFHADNHIEGCASTTMCHKNTALLSPAGRVVAVVSVSSEYDQKTKVVRPVVTRMSSLMGVCVVGGVSKLLARHPDAVMRVSCDTGGSIAGSGRAHARYWWVSFDLKSVLPRNACQKAKLENRFGDPLAPGDTEIAYMQRQKYRRVHNSGVVNVREFS